MARRAVLTAATVLVAFAIIATAGYLVYPFRTVQCDGSVPEWMIPSDYDGGGCVELRPAWEANLPWNAGKTELVCLGMCADPYPARSSATN
jgi:hypothetical protein